MQKIIEKKVKLYIISTELEETIKIIINLFQQLCNVSHFTQHVLDKQTKIDEELKKSVDKLTDEPLTFQDHYSKIKHFMSLQLELRKEEENIREEVLELQAHILPHLEVIQVNIKKAKELIATLEISVMDHMEDLSSQLQAQLSTLEALKDTWKPTYDRAKSSYQGLFDKM